MHLMNSTHIYMEQVSDDQVKKIVFLDSIKTVKQSLVPIAKIVP